MDGCDVSQRDRVHLAAEVRSKGNAERSDAWQRKGMYWCGDGSAERCEVVQCIAKES